jgi:mono/diheme cytochrome c family protein
MKRYRKVAIHSLLVALFAVRSLHSAYAADPAVERGRYLVAIGACNSCHTPGYLRGSYGQKLVTG